MKAILLLLLLPLALTCPNNCDDCNPAAETCFACSEGFELSILGTCIDAQTIPACTLYGPTNQCFACKPTYTLTNGACVKDFSACIETDPADDTSCITCSFGTVLANKRCVGTINCQDAINPCHSCALGFSFAGTQCIDKTGYCKTVGNNGVCKVCNDGFKLVGYTCVSNSISAYGCYIYDSNDFCTLCKNGFSSFQGSCLLPSQIHMILSGSTDLNTILSQRGGSTSSVITTLTDNGFGSSFGNDFGGFESSSSFNTGATNTTTITTSSVPHIQNCNSPDQINIGKCLVCDQGYYPTLTGCSQVSFFCNTNNPQTGDCLTCKFGLQLSNGKCNDIHCSIQDINGCHTCQQYFLLNANKYCDYNDVNCVSATSTRCNQCISGYFVTINGMCQKLPTNCLTANVKTNGCSQCINGYKVNTMEQCQVITTTTTTSTNTQVGGVTTISKTTTNTTNKKDPNCIRFVETVCIECSNRYYMNQNNICSPVNPQCKEYSSNGACTTCYPGYSMSQGICAVAKLQDPFCKSFTPGGICTLCYTGYFYNLAKAACQQNNPQCKGTNQTDGSCTACYPSFTLNNGVCSTSSQDPNCQKLNGSVCLQCSPKFYLDTSGKCKQTNSYCKTVDTNGACLSCYNGYVISGIACVVGGSSNSDVNCQTFENGLCKKCYSGFFANSKGVCVQKNPLCKTSDDSTGACLTCFPGYIVSSEKCIPGISAINSDLNCKSVDQTNLCNSCYSGYYLNSAKTCIKLDPLCKNYTTTFSQCGGCYDGYTLSNGICIISTQVTTDNTDTNCIKYQGTVCLTCANGYYHGPNGLCAQLNPLCKSSDMSNGACTQCYSSFTLMGDTCIQAASINIAYCATIAGNVCSACISGYYVLNGGCELIDILCDNFDQHQGICLGCRQGYVLQLGQCIYPSQGIDPNCVFYTNSYCSKCGDGFALINYSCSTIDPNCLEFDFPTNTCKSCATGKIPMGPSCV